MRFCTLSVIGICLLAGAAPIQAQRIDSPYRFLDTSQGGGPFVGYVATGSSTLEQGPASGMYFGARYGIRVSGPFAIEAELGYLPTTRSVFAVDTLAADSTDSVLLGEADANLLLASVSLRFNLTGARTWNSLQPYFELGGGVAVDVAGNSELDEELEEEERFDIGTSFAGQLGAGVDWFFSDRLSLRLDARNQLWRLTTPLGFRTSSRGRLRPETEWVQNFVTSAGISLHF